MRGWFSGDVVKRLGEERRISECLNNLRSYKIIWCLLFIADEKPIDSIADLLDISTRTVRNWLSQFMLCRFSWLLGHHW
jgi:hypothetical protein